MHETNAAAVSWRAHTCNLFRCADASASACTLTVWLGASRWWRAPGCGAQRACCSAHYRYERRRGEATRVPRTSFRNSESLPGAMASGDAGWRRRAGGCDVGGHDRQRCSRQAAPARLSAAPQTVQQSPRPPPASKTTKRAGGGAGKKRATPEAQPAKTHQLGAAGCAPAGALAGCGDRRLLTQRNP